MGADFLLACAELPRDTNNQLTLGPIIASIVKQRIIDMPEPLEEAYAEEAGLGDDTAWVLESALQVVEYWIGQENVLHDRRVDMKVLGEIPWLFTGGMSWGDPPTEAWDEVVMLAWVADLYYADTRFDARIGPDERVMEIYEVGVIMRFHADDPEHAMEQFVDAVQGAEILGAINHIEVLSDEEE